MIHLIMSTVYMKVYSPSSCMLLFRAEAAHTAITEMPLRRTFLEYIFQNKYCY